MHAWVGRRAGKGPVQCRSCMDAARCATSRFFQHRADVPNLSGGGSVISDPCPKCRGEARLLRERVVEAKFRRESRMVPASVSPDSAKRARFGGPAATCMSFCTSKSIHSLSARATTCTA